ncbi:MAG: OmpA family protein [Bacteroidota bacterium]
MKREIIIIVTFIAIMTFSSSCVLKKKYIEEQGKRKECEGRESVLKKEIKSANGTINLLNNKITKLNKDISEKESDITGLKNQNLEIKEQLDKITSESLSNKQKMDLALKKRLKELEARELAIKDMEDMLKKKDQAMYDLMDNISKALNQYTSDELTIEMNGGKVYVAMSDKLLFKSGSIKVDEKGKNALSLLASVLIKNPELDVIIEGHTDNVPIKTDRFSDNWDLSAIRATSVIRILTEEYGLNSSQVTASGRGEFMPKASNETSEGKAINRRTEIIIAPKLDEIYKALSK